MITMKLCNGKTTQTLQKTNIDTLSTTPSHYFLEFNVRVSSETSRIAPFCDTSKNRSYCIHIEFSLIVCIA